MRRIALAITCLAASIPSQLLEVPLWPKGVPGAPAEFADGVVSSASLTNKKADRAHFDASSLREFGRRYGKVMSRVQSRVR